MKHNNAFPPENIDEQVEHSIATSFPHASPESKMLQRLAALYEADRHSTERVEQRLAQHLAQRQTTARASLALVTPVPPVQKGRKPSMQTIERPTPRRAASRFTLIAATLFVSLLVGSLLLVFNLARTSHQTTQTAAQPTTTAGIYYTRNAEVYRLDLQTRKVIWHTHLTNQPVHIIANKPEPVVGHPTVIGANVYISADNILTALDAQTGKLRWSHTFGASLGSIQLFGDSGQIYVSSTDRQKFALYVMNQANGTITATYTPIEGQTGWNDPTVVNGVLYYQTGDAWDATIYAVQLPNEKPLWHAALSKQQMFNGLLVQDGVVYVNSQVWNGGKSPNKGQVEVFAASNGHKIWQLPDLNSPVRTLAAVNNLIYVATVSNGLFAFNLQTHELIWQKADYNTDAIKAYNNILFVSYQVGFSETDPGRLDALNAANGQSLWQKIGTGLSSWETLAVSGNILYGQSFSGDGNHGTLFAANISTGAQLWTMSTSTTFPGWGIALIAE